MEVEDEGGPEVCAAWTGYRTAQGSTDTEELLRWGRCFAVPRAPVGPLPDSVADSAMLTPEQEPVVLDSLRLDEPAIKVTLAAP